MTDHPITPPIELVQQWEEEWHHSKVKHVELEMYIATQAAQWELEACCSFLEKEYPFQFEAKWECTRASDDLRAARRPKPKSLKEQALIVLDDADLDAAHENILRRALEALPDD